MTFRPGCSSSARRVASVVSAETNEEVEARLLGVIATDQSGNEGTATRTVIIEAASTTSP